MVLEELARAAAASKAALLGGEGHLVVLAVLLPADDAIISPLFMFSTTLLCGCFFCGALSKVAHEDGVGLQTEEDESVGPKSKMFALGGELIKEPSIFFGASPPTTALKLSIEDGLREELEFQLEKSELSLLSGRADDWCWW